MVGQMPLVAAHPKGSTADQQNPSTETQAFKIAT
jgi:hypothetical protein